MVHALAGESSSLLEQTPSLCPTPFLLHFQPGLASIVALDLLSPASEITQPPCSISSCSPEFSSSHLQFSR